MNNIIFLGAFPTKRLIEESKGKIDSLYCASETIIEGLQYICGGKLNVITSPDIASYPINRMFYSSHVDYDGTVMVSTLNVSLIKQLWTIVTMTLAVVKNVRKNKGKTTLIIPYMVFRHVLTAKLIKILCGRKIEVCLVVPDVFFPQNRILKLFNRWAEKIAVSFDSFVLYTKAMANYLHVEGKKHIVIEGFLKITTAPISLPKDKFIVCYTGSLNVKYGIMRLVQAFQYIKKNDIELHLYGAGDADSQIKEYSRKDERIKFYGLVPKKQATDALHKSSLLINPRNATDGEYVQYSFPSKDIDYLASGIPCVLCKLPGMPKEYYSYFFDAGDGSSMSLSKAIMEVYKLDTTSRTEFAKRAQSFIRERMDLKHQAQQIVEMINS